MDKELLNRTLARMNDEQRTKLLFLLDIIEHSRLEWKDLNHQTQKINTNRTFFYLCALSYSS